MKLRNDWIILFIFILLQLGCLFYLSKLIIAKTDLLLEAKHKLKAYERKDESLAQLQQDYGRLEKDIEVLNQALPDKSKIVGLINQIESEASSSGVMAKISFGQQSIQSETGGVKSLVFNVTLKGSYYQVISFIKSLEKMPQVITVEKMNIQSPAGIEGENNVTLILKCYIDPDF